jgi:hypothetical protein
MCQTRRVGGERKVEERVEILGLCIIPQGAISPGKQPGHSPQKQSLQKKNDSCLVRFTSLAARRCGGIDRIERTDLYWLVGSLD